MATGNIRVIYGQTINKGNFQSEKYELMIELPFDGGTLSDAVKAESNLQLQVKKLVEKRSGMKLS